MGSLTGSALAAVLMDVADAVSKEGPRIHRERMASDPEYRVLWERLERDWPKTFGVGDAR